MQTIDSDDESLLEALGEELEKGRLQDELDRHHHLSSSRYPFEEHLAEGGNVYAEANPNTLASQEEALSLCLDLLGIALQELR